MAEWVNACLSRTGSRMCGRGGVDLGMEAAVHGVTDVGGGISGCFCVIALVFDDSAAALLLLNFWVRVDFNSLNWLYPSSPSSWTRSFLEWFPKIFPSTLRRLLKLSEVVDESVAVESFGLDLDLLECLLEEFFLFVLSVSILELLFE